MPAKLSNPRDLFLQLLGEALYVERRLAGEVLDELIRAAQDEELVQGLRNHLEQTRQHAARAETVFRSFAAEPSAARSASFEGLVGRHDEIATKIMLPRVADFFHAAAAAETEHYEIALYTALVRYAAALGAERVAQALEETLEEERAALETVERALERLAPEATTQG